MLLKSSFKKVLISLLLFIILFIFPISCDSSESLLITIPPPDLRKITLSVEDVSCTEMWLRIKTDKISLPAEIKLYKIVGEQTVMLTTKDSILYIDSLFPSQTYNYMAILNTDTKIRSKAVKGSTLDPTSHNFTWQTFTFGDPEAGSSELYDVTIIDENNIYAVGEIYLNDSTGQPDPLPYNIAHWNGLEWKVQRLTYQDYPPAISSIFAINENDIWFDPWFHWDGQSFQEISIDPILIGVGVNKMWVNENGIYVVGNGGFIAQRSNNGSWQRIESGTTTNVNDVWGINDSAANNSLVLCTVSNRYELGDHKLLSISGNMATEYFTWPYTRLYSIWFNSPREIYIVGAGAYVYKNNSLKIINLPTNYFLTGVKGNALNDIYISSSEAVIFHYNGINWIEMSNGIYGKYEGMDVKGNTEVFVGYNIEGGIVGKAVVTIGKHY